MEDHASLPEPNTTLEEAVFQLAEEIKRLRAERVPGIDASEDASSFLDQEKFRYLEDLLRQAVEMAQPRTRRAKWMDRLAPHQRRTTMLLLEILTGFFEAYRTLAYRVSDIGRGNIYQISDLKRAIIELQIETARQFDALGKTHTAKENSNPPE